MARTVVANRDLRLCSNNKAARARVKTKLDEHDTALDQLLPSAGSSAGTKARAYMYAVRAVTTSNLASFTGISTTFDGLTLVAGDRILVAAQSTAAQNGIYVVGTVGGGTANWTRATDFAVTSPTTIIPNGSMFCVDAGTIGANRVYKLTNAGSIAVGSTGLTFSVVYPEARPQAATTRSGPGAVALTAPTCLFTSSGAGDALTVADGSYVGQHINIVHIVKGSSGTGVITQTSGAKLTAGISTITLSTLFASVTLEWSGSLWNPVINSGCTIA